ncbi:helix-turn-helix domain-containing protein [Leeia oryzae]|uniref:helix-turn-helix domain-containing protein n=1 Tax=Leeia oryzae TaxID=356662 RepID=UPI00037D205C|nr:XRE family transcriptional regulator [Leeia oryzae]
MEVKISKPKKLDTEALAGFEANDASFSTSLGARVRKARQEQALTLENASKLCGVSRSTLSKIENEQMSPTFDVLQKIVAGLKIEFNSLFGTATGPTASGRRAVTRQGEGERYAQGKAYKFEVLANELAHKVMLPFRITITARSPEDIGKWSRHEGEEFIYVLSGSLRVYTELYTPVDLGPGDSIYYDSKMGHGAVSTSEEDAEVLWMTTQRPSI